MATMMQAMRNLGTNNVAIQTLLIYGLGGGVAAYAYRRETFYFGIGFAAGIALVLGMDDPLGLRVYLRKQRQEKKKEATK
jgi:hypothetical protein